MDCEHAENLIDGILTDDPELDRGTRRSFAIHLETCEACREEYERAAVVLHLLQTHGTLDEETTALVAATDSRSADGASATWDERAERGLARFLDAAETAGLYAVSDVDGGQPDGTPAGQIDPEPVLRLTETEGGRPLSTPARFRRSLDKALLRRWRWGAAAAAACLAMVTAAWLTSWRSGTPNGGDIEIAMRADAVAPLELVSTAGSKQFAYGQEIDAGGQIREFMLGGIHRVTMNRGAVLVVQPPAETEGRYVVDLAGGEIFVEVQPGHPFSVATPHAQLEITGTKFNVMADAEYTDLTLLKGSVRFSGERGEPVDVRAGHASRVVFGGDPTPPMAVDADAVAAWAREAAAGLAAYRSDQGIPGVDVAELLPTMPDYRTWGYERFVEEKRDWFASQFPWAMQIENLLQEDHGIDADYLEILVVSGDIWQFRFGNDHRTASRVPRLTSESIERTTAWYGVDRDQLREAILTPRKVLEASTDRKGIEEWRAEISKQVRAESLGGSWDLALVSLHSSEYLNTTRGGLALWLNHHPKEAQRLLQTESYVAAFIHRHLGIGLDVDLALVLEQLERYTEACRECGRTASTLLATPREHICLDSTTAGLRQIERILDLLQTGEAESMPP